MKKESLSSNYKWVISAKKKFNEPESGGFYDVFRQPAENVDRSAELAEEKERMIELYRKLTEDLPEPMARPRGQRVARLPLRFAPRDAAVGGVLARCTASYFSLIPSISSSANWKIWSDLASRFQR